MQKAPALSVVIPAYNERESLPALCARVKDALRHKFTYEILIVDDGSTDGTIEACAHIKDITLVRLMRNYGQATALDAGFREAHGELIVSLDGDGQNDPMDIPALVDKLKHDNIDVVAGWRRERHDPRKVRVLTRIGRFARRAFINDGIHDSGCTLRVYTSEAAKSLDIGGEMHRYILALLRWKGFKIGEMPVRHHAREKGVSKYGSGKAVRGLLDLIYVWFIYKYSQRPLHLFGYASLVSLFLGICAAAWTLYNYFTQGIHFARDIWLAVSCFLLLSSLLFFSFGIVLDLLIRISLNTSAHSKRYYIREITRT